MQVNPTLDQLQILVAVADCGGFSAAARALNRAQSVISYAIANLEEQLQLTLFERTRTRQPGMTEAGLVILEEARRMIADLEALRGRASSLREGLEGELVLAVSRLVPERGLVDVLRDFQANFPTVPLQLHWGSSFMVNDMIEKGAAHLGIGGRPMRVGGRLIFERVGQSFMVPVVASFHVLAQIRRPLSTADVRNETQVVVSDSTGQTQGRDFNVLSLKTWRVNDVTAKHALLKAGLGWGGLPTAVVEDDLREGRLVALSIDTFETSNFPVFAVWRASRPPGPAARWMVKKFRDRLASCPKLLNQALPI